MIPAGRYNESMNQRESIKQAINEMIDNLTQDQLDEVEDFIVNNCEDFDLFTILITGKNA